MAYTLLKGRFVIRYPDLPRSGPEPDGDTIKFLPDSPDIVLNLPRISGRAPQINARGISVRLEAIDALETHCQQTHQELGGANKARHQLLEHLGFRNVVEEGFVLSNGIDANGRMIGFVYKGVSERDDPGEDGSTLVANTRIIDKSVNAMLLADGLVFPAFYGTLPTRLREDLATKSRAARDASNGIWPKAMADPNSAVRVSNLQSLTTVTIWPKLFRRLVSYFQEGNIGLSGFIDWLRRGSNDDIFRLDTNEDAKFSDIIFVDRDRIKMDVWPEDIVVEPAPASSRSRL